MHLSQDPVVKRTLAQALRLGTAAGTVAPTAERQKVPLPVGVLRLSVGWLRVQQEAMPGRRHEFAQDACWLAFGFFGMLRRSKLAALAVEQDRPARGWGGGVLN